jgi:endo-1,4-beta-mannosidase
MKFFEIKFEIYLCKNPHITPMNQMKKLWSIVLICFLTVILIPMTESFTISTPKSQLTWNDTNFRPIGVNYYPRTHPWTRTWTEFNTTELRDDCVKIKSIGGNCLRTFIQWELIEPEPWIYNNTIVNRIIEFFNIVSEAGLALIFSFFDFGPPKWAGVNVDQMYVNSTLIEHQNAQLKYLIPLLNTSKAAFIWDIRNEPTSSIITIQNFTLWVENISSCIRALGDTHYITVGGAWGNFEDPRPYAHSLDIVCMHYYGRSNEPDRIRNFDKYIQIFLATGKPIIIEEFGWPNFDPVTEQMQEFYYKSLFEKFDQYNVAGFLPWCLWDYGDHFWNNTEANFGLLRYDGTWKPATYAFFNYASGSHEYVSRYWIGGPF